MVLSAAYYLTIRGIGGLKMVLGMVPVWLAMSFLNPLLNTGGQTVLFTYFGNRPYTLEALYYGMALGAMLITILLWFASVSVKSWHIALPLESAHKKQVNTNYCPC